MLLSTDPLSDFYRCPQGLLPLLPPAGPLSPPGYFQFGPGTTCYGPSTIVAPPRVDGPPLPDLFDRVLLDGRHPVLPFDPCVILDNLRLERYPLKPTSTFRKVLGSNAIRALYYAFRSIVPDTLRRASQRLYLADFRTLSFPQWPIDTTVERFQERLLLLAMSHQGLTSVPFIWFWPDGAPAAATITHDVETTAGRDFIPSLIEIDGDFGIQSSFQIVPEKRYTVPDSLLMSIREQNCEVNVQGLDHDGNLFENERAFQSACQRVNQYGRDFAAEGFRSPCMYRNPEWFDSLDFSYDMSMPNAAHLEPQRGGCCTIFPYFIGRILELPLTTAQDYSLFHILRAYSIDLWKSQLERILHLHGLASFIIHPDYILESRPRAVYQQLLGYLAGLRTDAGLWITLPGNINRWWRRRRAMQLVCSGGFWQVTGEGRESARVAFAHIRDNRIFYTVAPGYQASIESQGDPS